uniref:Uncharacterized protein n=1 Tax=Rhizophora mucronata TaxID=61149 RepID=A0A2P2NWV2_RHIMU
MLEHKKTPKEVSFLCFAHAASISLSKSLLSSTLVIYKVNLSN